MWLGVSPRELACRCAMFKLMRVHVLVGALAARLYGCHIAHNTLGLCRQPLHASCLGT